MLLGEFPRTLDERFRLSLPPELLEALGDAEDELLLAKEGPGALSLWQAERWRAKHEQGVDLVTRKIAAGRLDSRMPEVQSFGRMLSTRQRPIQLSGRGRLVIPEGFREFLGVEPGGAVMVVGAAVCLEIWRPERWIAWVNEQIGQFPQLFQDLSA